MRRREFIAGVAALIVSPRRARARETRRRLGFLAIGDGSGQTLNQAERAFLDGLRSRGWIDGSNLIIEFVFPSPRIDCQLQSSTSLLSIPMCWSLRDRKPP